jgi:hypothetical protein
MAAPAGNENPAGNQGQIVTVPGQWVGGKWVPEHQVQVAPDH